MHVPEISERAPRHGLAEIVQLQDAVSTPMLPLN